jgi:hypothetical protein
LALRLWPVFSASVTYLTLIQGGFYRAVSLNDQALGGYPSEERARARAD